MTVQYDEENKAIVITDCDADLVIVRSGDRLLGEIPISNGEFILSNVEGVQIGDTLQIEKHKITVEEVRL